MTSYGLKQRFSSVVVYVFLGVMAFLSIFPFLWMVIGATNTTSDIIKGKMSFGESLLLNATTFFTQVNAPLIFWNVGARRLTSTEGFCHVSGSEKRLRCAGEFAFG